jgi:hypothetical protein
MMTRSECEEITKEIEWLILEETPSKLGERISRELVDYSVAFLAAKGHEFSPVGSGTTVSFLGDHYFLTASHVWHGRYGYDGLKSAERIVIPLKEKTRRRFIVSPDALEPLGPPKPKKWSDWGPDIILLRIPPAMVGEFIAVGRSFYNLSIRRERAIECGIECRFQIGAPAEKGTYTAEVALPEVHAMVVFPETHYFFSPDRTESSNPDFDFVDVPIDTRNPDVAKNLEGVSGGGFWKVFIYKDSDGEFAAFKVLEGVAIHQKPRGTSTVVLRCHGPQSIGMTIWHLMHDSQRGQADTSPKRLKPQKRRRAAEVYEALPAETKAKIIATLDKHRPKASAAARATLAGRPLTADTKAKLSKSHRQTFLRRPPVRTIPLWLIAEDTLGGLASTASAEKLGGHQADVYRQRQRMGLPTRYPGVLRHGEVLAYRHFDEFCDDLGVTKKEAAPFCGISYRSFANRIAKKTREAPLSGRNPSDPSSAHVGRNLDAAIQKIVDRFCYQEGKRWKVRLFLTSEFRNIEKRHPQIAQAGMQIREAFKNGVIASADSRPVLDWICWRCTDKGETNLRSLLFFSFTLRKLLADRPAVLFGENFRKEEFAKELLALDYGAAPNTIEDVIAGKAEPLDPQTLRLAALDFIRPKTAEPESKRSNGRGAPKKQKPNSLVFGQQIESMVPRFQAAVQILVTAKKETSDPAVWELRLRHPGKLSDLEAKCLVASRTPTTAAIRFIADRNKKKVKTIQNLYSQFLAQKVK